MNSVNPLIVSGMKIVKFTKINNMKADKRTKKNMFLPSRSSAKLMNRPPKALLEDVRNIATDTEIIKNIEKLFFKIFDDFSKKNAIQKGQIIFNQHPA